MEGHLLMSRKELSRKSIFELVQSGRLNLVTASQHLGLSYRQTLRVYARFSSEGDAVLYTVAEARHPIIPIALIFAKRLCAAIKNCINLMILAPPWRRRSWRWTVFL